MGKHKKLNLLSQTHNITIVKRKQEKINKIQKILTKNTLIA